VVKKGQMTTQSSKKKIKNNIKFGTRYLMHANHLAAANPPHQKPQQQNSSLRLDKVTPIK